MRRGCCVALLLTLAGCEQSAGLRKDSSPGDSSGAYTDGHPGVDGQQGRRDQAVAADLVAAADRPAPDAAPAPALPERALWEQRMTGEGDDFCDEGAIAAAIGASGVQTEGNVWYYDGSRVYQQVARYTGDPSWLTCAGYVNDAYRAWVLAASEGVSWPVGALSGWRVFSQGLLMTHQRTGETDSKEAVLRLARYSAFAGKGGGAACETSRETAYLIKAYLDAEELGEPRNPLLATAVDYALGHLDGWFVSKTCGYVQPFMVGLTLDALIHYHEKTADSRVPPAVETAADELWARFWVAADQAFVYDSGSTGGAPDLNLLIASAYAWLWQRSGAPRQLDRGDAVFAGGVRGAGFWSGKHYSQSYRASFDYVKWRSAAPGTIQPLTRY